ncbi:hypothetical protein KKF61_06390 [Patescibacteria group bacterium]|nr:hypothetical protein [Patescibacteria group bacterium]
MKKVMFVIMVLTVIVTVGCTSQAEKEAMIFHETAISLMKDYSQAEWNANKNISSGWTYFDRNEYSLSFSRALRLSVVGS